MAMAPVRNGVEMRMGITTRKPTRKLVCVQRCVCKKAPVTTMITKKLRQLRVHQLQLSLLSHTAKNPSPFGGFTFNLVKKQFVEILVGPLEVGPLYSIDEFLRDIC
jgi:hypothetical protein